MDTINDSYTYYERIEILLQFNTDIATADEYGRNDLHYEAYNNETTTTAVQLPLNNMKLEDITARVQLDTLPWIAAIIV